MKKLIEEMKSLSYVCLHPKENLPKIKEQHTLSKDLIELYQTCNGFDLFDNESYEYPLFFSKITEFIPFNEFYYEKELLEEAKNEKGYDSWLSHNWYVLADIENGNRIAIDLHPLRYGYCYLTNWESYHMEGYMPIVAKSVKEFVKRSLQTNGDKYYWEESHFESYGDAFD